MGVLTEELTQLRNEILALRSVRQGLAQTLERGSEERRAEVSQTLADFSKKFTRMSRSKKADRLGSLAELKRAVNGLRTEVHTDLNGIRLAWSALNTPSRSAEEKLESQAKQDPEGHLEEGESETGGQSTLPAGGEKPARKKRKH